MEFDYQFDGDQYRIFIGSETDDFERVHPTVAKIEENDGTEVNRETFLAIVGNRDFSRAFDRELHRIRMENFE